MCLWCIRISAVEFSIGGGVGYSTPVYKDYDKNVSFVPMINLKSERFYIAGLGAGVNVWKNDMHTISLGASYFGQSFDPDDTDDSRLKTLDKRRGTMMVDTSYTLKTQYGMGSIKLSGDVLGKSNGFIGDISYRYPVRYRGFTILPGFGVKWASDNQNDYYYGISGKEAARSGLGRYEAKQSFSPYVSLNVRYQITDKWGAFAGGRVEYLGKEIRDSPMVGRSVAASIMAGVQISF